MMKAQAQALIYLLVAMHACEELESFAATFDWDLLQSMSQAYFVTGRRMKG